MIQSIKNELVDEPKYQPCRRFICNDLVEKLVKNLKTDKIEAIGKCPGFKVLDAFNTKKQRVLGTIKNAFERENM